jgi:hypothetical protein
MTQVRHLALALVLANLALVGLLGLVLPSAALGLLPLLAIAAPLLSAAVLEHALQQTPKQPERSARTPRAADVAHALPHAA